MDSVSPALSSVTEKKTAGTALMRRTVAKVSVDSSRTRSSHRPFPGKEAKRWELPNAYIGFPHKQFQTAWRGVAHSTGWPEIPSLGSM